MSSRHPPRKIACVNSLTAKRKPSISQIQNSRCQNLPSQKSLATQSSTDRSNQEAQSQICELQAEISSFKKCLNEEVKFRECISRGNLEEERGTRDQEYITMPDRRNPTILEENEDAEDTHPDQDALDLFYSFLSQKYETVSEKLAYFELIFKMQNIYKEMTSHKATQIQFDPDFLSYFANLWLDSMGFRNTLNQQKTINSILAFSKDQLSRSVVQGAYTTLFGEFLSPNLHTMFVLQVCRYGWQYLIFFAGRFFSYVKHNLVSQQFNKAEHQKKIQALIKQV